MKIFVQGLWHCGCVISSCLASLNHSVIAYDRDKKLISRLKKNITPIYEPKLNDLIKNNIKKKRLFFVNNLKNLNSSKVVWFTYDTPIDEKDKANTKYVIDEIKNTLKELKTNKFVIISSQLPVGTIKNLEIFSKKELKKKFHFFYCPENLRLGNSISSFLRMERLIVGFRNDKAKNNIEPFLKTINKNLIWMKIESAEITKHAINSFLASSVSFINEISAICEHTNADAKEVEMGLKSEPRIGKKAFLSPGGPYSGGTLGRDINYLVETSKKFKLKNVLLPSIKLSNDIHKNWLYKILEKLILKKKIKKVTIWGLTYTQNTDTLRGSLSIEISKWLKNLNIKVDAYDSNIKKFPQELKKLVVHLPNPMSGIKSSDILIILNKSSEFLNLSPHDIRKRNKNIFIIDPNHACSNLSILYKKKYISVGKPNFLSTKDNLEAIYDYDLKGKVVLVTGASKGLGYEIAKNFLKSGSNLIICSRNYFRIKKAYKKLKKIKKNNQKIFYSITDISYPDQIEKLIKYTMKKFKKIDILVNNAGIYGPKGNIEKLDWKEWTKTIKINLFGSILLCRAILPYFKKRNNGKIIQLSGGGATNPLPFISSYAVSKAAIVRFVETLSEEVKKYNIDINAVAPGPLNTDMLKEILKAGPKKVGKDFYNKALKQKKDGGTSLNKVCDLILFLASKHSNGISGKLVSALWDDWQNWINHKQTLKNSDVYTLRRITGKERGYLWGDK